MKDMGQLQFISVKDRCVDSCQDYPNMVSVPGKMACECLVGYKESWMDNCDPATSTTDCFLGCNECLPGATMSSTGQCECDDTTFELTMQGCRPVDEHNQACAGLPNAMFIAQYDMCQQFLECPDEHRFEGCSECFNRDMYNGLP
jgi:hypothetical protein